MRRVVIDLDDWIFSDELSSSVENLAVFREQLDSYRAKGFEVVVFSSSGMVNSDGKLNENIDGLTPESLALLTSVGELCDKIFFGKPPTGQLGLVLDDKAVTPEEFLAHDFGQIKKLVSEK